MTRERAEQILLELGWNTYGAEEIIDGIGEDLESMTENDIKALSEDYMDR